MQIISGKINWRSSYCINAKFDLVVDRTPNLEDMRFENKGALYYAEKDGFVRFYYYDQRGIGFGGAKLVVNMKDGGTRTLLGPWSSRAAVMNANGFGPCVEASILEAEAEHHCPGLRAVTLGLLKKAIDEGKIDTNLPKELQGSNHTFTVGIRQIDFLEHGEPMFVPVVFDEDGVMYQKIGDKIVRDPCGETAEE